MGQGAKLRAQTADRRTGSFIHGDPERDQRALRSEGACPTGTQVPREASQPQDKASFFLPQARQAGNGFPLPPSSRHPNNKALGGGDHGRAGSLYRGRLGAGRAGREPAHDGHHQHHKWVRLERKESHERPAPSANDRPTRQKRQARTAMSQIEARR